MAVRFDPDPTLEAELARTVEVAAVLEALAAAAAETARRLVPVASGDLRDSIDHEVAMEAAGQVGRVFATDFKASWVEFGTIRRPARPFIRPALETEVGPLREDTGA